MCIACVANGLGPPAPVAAPGREASDERSGADTAMSAWTAADSAVVAIVERQLSRFARGLIESLAASEGFRAEASGLGHRLNLPGSLSVEQLTGEIARYCTASRRRPPVYHDHGPLDDYYQLDRHYARLSVIGKGG